LGEIEESERQTTEKLMNKGKSIGLQVNEQKTKYLKISRRDDVQESLYQLEI